MTVLEASLLADLIVELPSRVAARGAQDPVPGGSLREAVEACQRQNILKALELCADNWANAARLLDLDPSSLHKLARRLGLK